MLLVDSSRVFTHHLQQGMDAVGIQLRSSHQLVAEKWILPELGRTKLSVSQHHDSSYLYETGPVLQVLESLENIRHFVLLLESRQCTCRQLKAHHNMSRGGDYILTSEERYQIAVSWGTIVGTWALMLVICGARVSRDPSERFRKQKKNTGKIGSRLVC